MQKLPLPEFYGLCSLQNKNAKWRPFMFSFFFKYLAKMFILLIIINNEPDFVITMFKKNREIDLEF